MTEPYDIQPEANNSASHAGSDKMHGILADALCKLGICVRNVGLYGRSHSVVSESLDNAVEALSRLTSTCSGIPVAVTESYLAVESFPIEDRSGGANALAGVLRYRGITELSIVEGVSAGEVLEFAEVLSLSVEDLTLHGGISQEMVSRGVVNFRVSLGVLPSVSREGKDPADIYEEALLLVEEAMKAVQSGLQISVPEIRAVISDSLHSLTHDDSTLLALAGIRSYDRYLSEHSVNVCILSMVFGKELGLDTSATLELGLSALLHDVGKVFIPADIVKKPGKLSEEEWQQIRRHPIEGARALAGMKDIPSLAPTIALEHHVSCDGSGYPSFSAYEQPHLLSRLVAIVDTYDALTTDRPYRESWTAQQAIAWMLYDAGERYDRKLLARFASKAGLYPIGSVVKMTSGDTAVVIGGSHENPTRPIVRIISAGWGGGVENTVIDLSLHSAQSIADVAQPVEALFPYTALLTAVQNVA